MSFLHIHWIVARQEMGNSTDIGVIVTHVQHSTMNVVYLWNTIVMHDEQGTNCF